MWTEDDYLDATVANSPEKHLPDSASAFGERHHESPLVLIPELAVLCSKEQVFHGLVSQPSGAPRPAFAEKARENNPLACINNPVER